MKGHMLRFLANNSLAALLILTCTSSLSLAKETIKWLTWEQSPEFVQNGQFAGQGYADKALKFFIENLPEYNHEIINSSVRRWEREASFSHACSPYLWGHFLKDKLLYSKPYTLSPPHSVIFLKQYEESFGPQGTLLSLEDLLKNTNLILMTLPIYIDREEKNPRYPLLHKYLSPLRGKQNLVELNHGTNEVDLRFLVHQRAHYSIGYTTTVIAQQRAHGIKDRFVTYGIKEHQEFKKIFVSCFNDRFGKEVISKINALLSPEELPRFLNYQEEWNGQSPAFRQEFKKQILPQTD